MYSCRHFFGISAHLIIFFSQTPELENSACIDICLHIFMFLNDLRPIPHRVLCLAGINFTLDCVMTVMEQDFSVFLEEDSSSLQLPKVVNSLQRLSNEDGFNDASSLLGLNQLRRFNI